MRKTGLLGLSLALMLAMSLQASAAVVGFTGNLNTKTLGANGAGVFGGVVGAIPVVNFSGRADVTDITGVITGGLFTNDAGAAINVSGGSVSLIENGINDTATFNITLAGDALGALQFTLQGDVITDATINQNNVSRFFDFPTTVLLTDFANGGGQYAGSVTAIPEPGTMSLMLGLVAGVAGWRRRRA